MIEVISIEKKFKIKFINKNLLKNSLTHKSHDSKKNYEKLEFIGDRVLGLVIANKLLELYPDEKEGILDKKLAFPPKAGQVWEPTAHRWVNPNNYGQTYSARGGRKRIRGSGTGARERSVSGHGKGRIRYEGAGRRFKGETDLAAQRRKQGFTHTAFKPKKRTKAKGGFKHGRAQIK